MTSVIKRKEFKIKPNSENGGKHFHDVAKTYAVSNDPVARNLGRFWTARNLGRFWSAMIISMLEKNIDSDMAHMMNNIITAIKEVNPERICDPKTKLLTTEPTETEIGVFISSTVDFMAKEWEMPENVKNYTQIIANLAEIYQIQVVIHNSLNKIPNCGADGYYVLEDEKAIFNPLEDPEKKRTIDIIRTDLDKDKYESASNIKTFEDTIIDNFPSIVIEELNESNESNETKSNSKQFIFTPKNELYDLDDESPMMRKTRLPSSGPHDNVLKELSRVWWVQEQKIRLDAMRDGARIPVYPEDRTRLDRTREKHADMAVMSVLRKDYGDKDEINILQQELATLAELLRTTREEIKTAKKNCVPMNVINELEIQLHDLEIHDVELTSMVLQKIYT